MENWGLGFQVTGRDDDVVGTLNQGIGEFADDIGQNFRGGHALVEEDIELGIMESLTSEVVMAGVSKVN